MISGHIWSRCVVNLWPFDFKMKPVHLCPELHLSCKFGKIPTAVLKTAHSQTFSTWSWVHAHTHALTDNPSTECLWQVIFHDGIKMLHSSQWHAWSSTFVTKLFVLTDRRLSPWAMQHFYAIVGVYLPKAFCICSGRLFRSVGHMITYSMVTVLGQEIMQPVWWPLFCHRRANAVEQSAWTASAIRHHLWTIQTIVENDYVWLAGPWCLVSEG